MNGTRPTDFSLSRTLYRLLVIAILALTLCILPCASSWAGVSGIGNADGSFENGLNGMATAGDVRLVAGFGAIRPTQGAQAVLLTTEPDAGSTLADTDEALIRIDQVTIPIETPQLRLDYVFLTNELTPTFTHDQFTVTLALINAGGEEILLQVDTLDPVYPAPWTGYAMQTGFRTLVADLSAHAGTGETVSIELRLVDVGDGRDNSAVFLDNMQLTALGEPQACSNFDYVALSPGDSLFVDGSCSTDSDGLIVEYRWDFGDGNERIGRFVEHTYAADGIYQVTLTVKDEAGNTSTTTFQVVVGDINHAPQIASAPIVLGADNTPYRYEVTVVDPEVTFGDSPTFALTESPTGMAIDPATGVITWTPTADDPRQNPVTVTVTDSLGLSDTQSFTLIVDAEVYIAATDDLGRLYTARSNGDGTFADYRFVEDVGRNTRGVTIADVDRDGDFDLLTGDAQGTTLTLSYFEKQGAQFAPPVVIAAVGNNTTPAGDFLMDMAAEDVNNDGNMDVVVNSNSANSWLLLNQGQLSFEPTTFFASDFETDASAWGGATCNTDFARDNTTANSGAWSLRVFATAAEACLSIDVSPANWQLTQGPSMTFSYRIPAGVPVGLMVFVTGQGWLFLGGSPAANSGAFPSISAPNLVDDDQWHIATIDLYHSVREQWPDAGEIATFACWSDTTPSPPAPS